jgi:hypothetical protein
MDAEQESELLDSIGSSKTLPQGDWDGLGETELKTIAWECNGLTARGLFYVPPREAKRPRPLVSRTDAERLIAAARREAEEARAECERLRMTDDERRLLSKYRRSAEREIEWFAVTSASYVADAKHATAVIGGLLARHDKGGAA